MTLLFVPWKKHCKVCHRLLFEVLKNPTIRSKSNVPVQLILHLLENWERAKHSDLILTTLLQSHLIVSKKTWRSICSRKRWWPLSMADSKTPIFQDSLEMTNSKFINALFFIRCISRVRHGARNYKYLQHSGLRCNASSWEVEFIKMLNFWIIFSSYLGLLFILIDLSKFFVNWCWGWGGIVLSNKN